MQLDADDIEAVARRVLTLLRDEVAAAPVRLVDARTLARALGVDRSWVYAHAEELQVVRIGNGRGRLRFDLDKVQQTLGSTNRRAPSGRVRSSGRRRVMDMGGELLPVDP
jgi:hypothetical protein